MKKTILAAAIASCLMPVAQAKIIEGRVTNEQGEAVANAVVKVRELPVSVRTDAEGKFELDLEPGEYNLDIKGGANAHFHEQITVLQASQGTFDISLTDELEHKLVITANPLEHTVLDMAAPATLVAGDELILKRAGTLGEILQFEPGISVSSFGPSVSRPVIRGLSGSRVLLTSNQMSLQDASTTSADHDAGMEPLLAEQVEVIKGPATLLYGSGAIGGVVNTRDRRINDEYLVGFKGGLEARLGDGATGEQTLVMALDGGSENWNWHLDASSSETDEIEIPGYAESDILLADEGETREGPPEEHLENSDSEKTAAALGLTTTRDWGYLGFAVSTIDKEYGLPGHSHEHEEEEEEGEEEEVVRLDMQQTRYDVRANVEDPFGSFNGWFTGFSYTDYEHVELEGDETGTMFDNEAWELRSYLVHESWSGWSGIWGLQITDRDFSAIGEEAFVPPSETESFALFAVEEKRFGNSKWEFGARYESQSVSAQGVEIDDDAFSFSLGNVYSLGEHNVLAFNINRAARFANAEELFSDGPHLATNSFEIGDTNLGEEISTNIDLSYRFENNGLSGEFNLFFNQFDDFIYAANVVDTDPCVSADAAAEAAAEELLLVCYKQQDADFNGAEFALNWVMNPDSAHQFTLGVVADYIDAELSSGENVPRIAPSKYGASLAYDYRDLAIDLSWLSYQDQDDVSDNELPTEGFDLLDLNIAYRIPTAGGNDWFLFFKGNNLLDEEARDHSSFLKDLAPRPGRGFVVGARYTFE